MALELAAREYQQLTQGLISAGLPVFEQPQMVSGSSSDITNVTIAAPFILEESTTAVDHHQQANDTTSGIIRTPVVTGWQQINNPRCGGFVHHQPGSKLPIDRITLERMPYSEAETTNRIAPAKAPSTTSAGNPAKNVMIATPVTVPLKDWKVVGG
jgi:hypothetical protein